MRRHVRFARALVGGALAACALAAVGCGSKVAFEPPSPAPSAPSAPATASLTPVGLSRLQIGLKRTWSGFSAPLYLTNAGDGSGRLFVVEQGGLVKVIENGKVQAQPFLDLRAKVSTGGERGLLGLAFSPDYENDGKIYVDYTDTHGNTVVERYTSPLPRSSVPMWGAPDRLLSIAQPYANHNGGCLQFGPDGYLYVGMGDGGNHGDPGNRAQNKDALLGKILRIDVSRTEGSLPYAIPPTNPSVITMPASAKPAPEVWALGVRNPWRFSFDASSGALWVGDVGQDAWEEIDYISRGTAAARAPAGGLNLGWRMYEGNHVYPGGALVPPPSRSDAFEWPLYEYPHPEGESVTGGYVYHGSDYGAMLGTYLFADFIKGWIGGIRLESPEGKPLDVPEARVLLKTKTSPASFGVDERGELYLVDLNGSVYRIIGLAK